MTAFLDGLRQPLPRHVVLVLDAVAGTLRLAGWSTPWLAVLPS